MSLTVNCWSAGLKATVCFGNKLYGYRFFSPCWESAAQTTHLLSLVRSFMQRIWSGVRSSSEWYDDHVSLTDLFIHYLPFMVRASYSWCHYPQLQRHCWLLPCNTLDSTRPVNGSVALTEQRSTFLNDSTTHFTHNSTYLNFVLLNLAQLPYI